MIFPPHLSNSLSLQVDSAQVATSITVLDRAYRTALYVTQNGRHSTVFYSSGGEDNTLGVVVGDALEFKVIPEKGIFKEPTESCKQSIRTRYLGHVTGYQPIRDEYFLIRSVPGTF